MKKTNQKQVLLCNGKSVVLLQGTTQPKGRAGSQATTVELTDADLQAVTGGGGNAGASGGDVDK